MKLYLHFQHVVKKKKRHKLTEKSTKKLKSFNILPFNIKPPYLQFQTLNSNVL